MKVRAQFARFAALQATPVPEPGKKAMFLAGLALIGGIVQRGRGRIE